MSLSAERRLNWGASQSDNRMSLSAERRPNWGASQHSVILPLLFWRQLLDQRQEGIADTDAARGTAV